MSESRAMVRDKGIAELIISSILQGLPKCDWIDSEPQLYRREIASLWSTASDFRTMRADFLKNGAEATVDVTTAAKSYIIVLTETARTERKAI